MTFPVADKLWKEGCKHCAALFIVRGLVEPFTPAQRNATMTFIRYGSKVYGITCKHVLEYLDCRNKTADTPGDYNLATLVNGTFYVRNEFAILYDSAVFPAAEMDVAIMQLHPDYPRHIGKVPIVVDGQNTPSLPPWNEIRHAVAAGFPESEKKWVRDPKGTRLAMTCNLALAEMVSPKAGRFTLHSDLEQFPGVSDFSGISGGPVFWSTEESYGLLGITYEASYIDPACPYITIMAELVTPERLVDWIDGNRELSRDIDWWATPDGR